MPHRPVCDGPCKVCPFRRVALPGWLGEGSPADFIGSIFREQPLPCHNTIDYRRRDWLAAWIEGRRGKMCMGALIFTANIGKVPRFPDIIPIVEPDEDLVFATTKEFFDHHNNAAVKSWE